MKRRTLKFMACAAVMALTLSVTACGGSDDGVKDDTVNVEADTTESKVEDKTEPEVEDKSEPEVGDEGEEEADVEEEANAGDDEYFGSLEEAFADPQVKSMFDLMLSSMLDDGMSYEVSGNDFALIYQFDDSITASDEISEALETAIEEEADAFKEMAGVFDEAIGQEGVCTVTVRYLDYEDNVLFEGTYAAD